MNDSGNLSISDVHFPNRMSSSCVKLCLQCRSLLSVRTVAVTWPCRNVAGVAKKILNGSSSISGCQRKSPARQIWKQQMCYYSDLTTKHLETEVKEDNLAEGLSGADVVSYKSHLLEIRDTVPATEGPVSLGTESVNITFKTWILKGVS